MTSLSTRCAGVRIAAVGAAVPKGLRAIVEETRYFPTADLQKISESTGVGSRRVVSAATCTSDLCYHAATAVLEKAGWTRDSLDALIFVSQTPDYVLPATACTLQSRLGLSNCVAAFDVNQGCSGYVYGLWVASALMQGGGVDRCLLLVGDTITRAVSPADRSTALLFGDAGTATLLEGDPAAPAMFFQLGTDGLGAENLIIPAGGFRKPMDRELVAERARERVNAACDADLHMDGGEIFTFALKRVPPLITETLTAAGWTADDADYFVFHQANAFMLRHLAKKLKLPPPKVPIALDGFGNTSSASIPLTIVSTLAAQLEGSRRLVLTGFGVGFSWASCAVQTAGLRCAPLVEVDG